MSLASDYAARCGEAAQKQVDVNQSAPPKFEGQNGSMSVTEKGELRITPGASQGGELILPGQAALAAANWIMSTFS